MSVVIMPPLEIIGEYRGYDRKLRKAGSFMDNDVTKLLVDSVLEVVNIAKTLVQIQYPPPSQPNEPPHRRTGKLQELIDIGEIRNFSVKFGSYASYSAALEYGTSKMLPRPFMTPAIIEMQEKFPDIAVNEFKRRVR